jgi:drug/metabolite transporter (DMT)-like permease
VALTLGMALFFVGVEPPRATASDPFLGNVLAAASGLSWALTVAGLRWLGRDEGGAGPGAPPRDGAAAATVAGNAIVLVLALPLALPVVESRPLDWALIAFLGVVQIACAYVLLTRAVRSVRALEASLLLLLEPVLNPVWAWLVHGETPGPWSLAGASVILVATAANALFATRPRPPDLGA